MFRFIHTADWQIGKAFGGFAAEKQGVLWDARLSAPDRIAEVARAQGAGHVLVAGDVFDSESLPARQVTHLLERLRAHAGLTWHLLPGNHDPDRPGGIYERLVRGGLPQNVRPCRQAEAVTLAPGVALLPSPLRARAQTADPAAWMRETATPPGTRRIGLAHGTVQGFGSSSDAAARIDPAIAGTAGLAYLALGDWHGTKEVAGNVWYSGTPEPDRYLGNESGHVLAVTIGEGKGGITVTPVLTRRFAWVSAAVAPRAAQDIDRLERQLAETGAIDRVLARITLEGQAPLAAHGAILAQLTKLEERLFHLELEREAFGVQPAVDDLAALGQGSDLAKAAEHLVALKVEGDPAAERALEILFRLAAGSGP